MKDWRADSARQHEEIIEAVRSTAQEQIPFNLQGVSGVPVWARSKRLMIESIQYLDEFGKALATEVRMLLGEVGRLREERRHLHL